MKMIKLDAIDSTNSYLKRLLTKDSLDDLTVVVSKHQTRVKEEMVIFGKMKLHLIWLLVFTRNLTTLTLKINSC